MKEKLTFFLLSFFLLVTALCNAQIEDPGDDLPPTDDPDPPGLFIDNLVYFLMIVGVLYVLYFFLSKSKSAND